MYSWIQYLWIGCYKLDHNTSIDHICSKYPVLIKPVWYIKMSHIASIDLPRVNRITSAGRRTGPTTPYVNTTCCTSVLDVFDQTGFCRCIHIWDVGRTFNDDVHTVSLVFKSHFDTGHMTHDEKYIKCLWNTPSLPSFICYW